jgi:BlaI family transcriptional regulator, penicillinase repressor
MSKPGELTKAEWTVIQAVWEHEPCTATEVQEKLSKATGWAYSTVRTLMDRMVGKDILSSEKVRNATLYRSRMTRTQAQRSEALSTLKQAFNGALTPMVQCLIDSGKVSEDELAELEVLIQSRKKSRKN